MDETESSSSVHTIMSCGKILGDTKVKIVRVQEEPVEANRMEVGEIWLAGSSKCLGYWNQPNSPLFAM